MAHFAPTVYLDADVTIWICSLHVHTFISDLKSSWAINRICFLTECCPYKVVGLPLGFAVRTYAFVSLLPGEDGPLQQFCNIILELWYCFVFVLLDSFKEKEDWTRFALQGKHFKLYWIFCRMFNYFSFFSRPFKFYNFMFCLMIVVSL